MIMNATSTKTARPVAIWAAMIVVYIAWGSTYLAIRYAIQSIPPFLMASFRFLLAGLILYLWRRLSGDSPPTAKQWRSGAIVGLFLLLGGNGLVVWAEQRVVSGIAALLVASAPLWMLLIDWARGKRKPGWFVGLGVLIGFLGIAVLAGPSQLTGLHGDIDLVGMGVLTLAAVFWAIGSLYSRSADLPTSPLLGTSIEMLCGGFGLLLAGSLTGEWGRLNLASITVPSLLGLGYLIVFGSLAGFSAYTWLLRAAPTSLVSTYAYVNPIVAIFAGAVFLNEPLSPRVLLAAAVIIGAVAMITLAQPTRKQPAAEKEPSLARGDD
jgi:drug/metabolite transporter (DMT)-like permease